MARVIMYLSTCIEKMALAEWREGAEMLSAVRPLNMYVIRTKRHTLH